MSDRTIILLHIPNCVTMENLCKIAFGSPLAEYSTIGIIRMVHANKAQPRTTTAWIIHIVLGTFHIDPFFMNWWHWRFSTIAIVMTPLINVHENASVVMYWYIYGYNQVINQLHEGGVIDNYCAHGHTMEWSILFRAVRHDLLDMFVLEHML